MGTSIYITSDFLTAATASTAVDTCQQTSTDVKQSRENLVRANNTNPILSVDSGHDFELSSLRNLAGNEAAHRESHSVHNVELSSHRNNADYDVEPLESHSAEKNDLVHNVELSQWINADYDVELH